MITKFWYIIKHWSRSKTQVHFKSWQLHFTILKAPQVFTGVTPPFRPVKKLSLRTSKVSSRRRFGKQRVQLQTLDTRPQRETWHGSGSQKKKSEDMLGAGGLNKCLIWSDHKKRVSSLLVDKRHTHLHTWTQVTPSTIPSFGLTLSAMQMATSWGW